MMRTRAIFGKARCKPWRQCSIHMVPFGMVSAVIYEHFIFHVGLLCKCEDLHILLPLVFSLNYVSLKKKKNVCATIRVF